MTQHVGNAVKGHTAMSRGAILTDNTSQIRLIGIVPWGIVEHRSKLTKKKVRSIFKTRIRTTQKDVMFVMFLESGTTTTKKFCRMKNDPCSSERNLCNYVRSLKKIQDFDEI